MSGGIEVRASRSSGRGDRVVLSDVSSPRRAVGCSRSWAPSGAGKSTLLRCLNRLAEPESGTIDARRRRHPRARPAGAAPPRRARRAGAGDAARHGRGQPRLRAAGAAPTTPATPRWPPPAWTRSFLPRAAKRALGRRARARRAREGVDARPGRDPARRADRRAGPRHRARDRGHDRRARPARPDRDRRHARHRARRGGVRRDRCASAWRGGPARAARRDSQRRGRRHGRRRRRDASA